MSETEEGKEEEALGDVVEEELAATSQAMEEAARRIQVSTFLSLSHALLQSLVRETGQTFRTGSTNYNKLFKKKSNILRIRGVKKEPISSSLLSDCVSAGDAGQVEGGRLWGKTGGERENPGLLYGPHEDHQDPHCTSQRPTGGDHRRGSGTTYILSHKLFDIFSSTILLHFCMVTHLKQPYFSAGLCSIFKARTLWIVLTHHFTASIL